MTTTRELPYSVQCLQAWQQADDEAKAAKGLYEQTKIDGSSTTDVTVAFMLMRDATTAAIAARRRYMTAMQSKGLY